MLTAIIAGILLFMFGVFIKGVFGHAMVLLVAWLAKNGLLVAFLKTRLGQRVARNVRRTAYARAGNAPRRRKVFRVFRRVARAEEAVVSRLGRLRAGVVAMVKSPPRR